MTLKVVMTTAAIGLAVLGTGVPAGGDAGAGEPPQEPRLTATSPELEQRDQAVTADDLRILTRAAELLGNESMWNRSDDRECRDDEATGRRSLFCALQKACTDVLGRYDHRRVALQEVRFAVEDVTRGQTFEHRLRDFNNLPTTRLTDIQAVLKVATDRVRSRLGSASSQAVPTASPAAAQPSPGEFARVVILKPKPDQAAAFAAGYERHLAWHRDHQDPWTWRGWTFLLGERIGQFMDGTFGHALANFDAAVDPAGDAADNAANVSPYADFVSHGVYERLPAASAGAALPDASPFLVLNTYLVVPGREAAFETAVARVAKDSAPRMSLFRLRLGGDLAQYLLMRPAPSFSAGAALPSLLLPAGVVKEARSELLRYQEKLSYPP